MKLRTRISSAVLVITLVTASYYLGLGTSPNGFSVPGTPREIAGLPMISSHIDLNQSLKKMPTNVKLGNDWRTPDNSQISSVFVLNNDQTYSLVMSEINDPSRETLDAFNIPLGVRFKAKTSGSSSQTSDLLIRKSTVFVIQTLDGSLHILNLAEVQDNEESRIWIGNILGVFMGAKWVDRFLVFLSE